MTEPSNSPNAETKPPKKKLNLGVRIAMALIGAIFMYQGIGQMSKGYAEMKAAESNSSGTEVTKVVKESLGESKNFKEAKGNMSFDYPANWTVAGDVSESTPFRANALGNLIDFRISKETVPAEMTAKNYVDAMDKIIATDSKIHDVVNISEDKMSVDGTDGIKRIQTMMQGESDIVIKQAFLVVVKDSNAYCMVGTSTDKLFGEVEPVFNKLYQSVKFK